MLHARRLVAQRCLYGVDKNPFAVDLAKLSLWLVTLGEGAPVHVRRPCAPAGDSLVGLSREQIASFRSAPEKGQQAAQARAGECGEERGGAPAGDPCAGDRRTTGGLSELLRRPRGAGECGLSHAMVASFFAHDSEKAGRRTLRRLAGEASRWLATGQHDAELRTGWSRSCARERAPCLPFHWEMEFPEVFLRDPGLRCVRGEPAVLGEEYRCSDHGIPIISARRDFLAARTVAADLVAYFFRRAFSLLRSGGAFGLIATNTICSGGHAYARAQLDLRPVAAQSTRRNDGYVGLEPLLSWLVLSMWRGARGSFLPTRWSTG